MFIKVSNRDRILYENILAGILYCDITDHLPCVVSLKCINYTDNNDRPKVRLYGEKNCEKFVERINSVQWDLIYSEHTEWYNVFITNVKYHYDQSFPLVKVSRKRMKDKPWVIKGIKISIKQNHRLYTASLRRNNASAVVKYYSENARVCAKWQWNARDCVTGLHDRRSRECNPVTPVKCVSLSFRTHTCVLAFITYIMCTNGIEMALVWWI